MTDHILSADPATIAGSAPQGATREENTKKRVIVQVSQFRDQDGRVLEAHSPLGAILPQYRFFANVTVMVDTPVGPQPIPLEIPIDAASVAEAFEVMDAQMRAKAPDVARAKIAQMTEVSRRQQIAQAGRIALPR